MRVKIVVGPGEVLAVVDGEVHVVQRVVCRAVDELLSPVSRNHVTVMNQDRPDLHEDEHDQVKVPLHRADEDEDVVRQRLHEPVGRVESECCPRSRHNPLVVWLMDVLVHAWVVLQPVNPVNGDIIEGDIQQCRDCYPCPAILADISVEKTLSPYLGEKDGKRHQVDPRDSVHGRSDFLADLVLQEARVMLKSPIKDEVVRQGREHPIEHRGANLRERDDGDALPNDVVARPRGNSWSDCRIGRS